MKQLGMPACIACRQSSTAPSLIKSNTDGGSKSQPKNNHATKIPTSFGGYFEINQNLYPEHYDSKTET
jgi:hypothetical protein